MATRMNPLAGRYFNDPAFAAGISNLASAFAPPGAEDYIAAEKVKGLRTQNSALADAYRLAGDDFDKVGIVADLFDPSNSYYAVDQSNATSRFNNAADNRTALTMNAADNETALRNNAFNAFSNPAGRQPTTEEDMLGILGIDAPGYSAAGPVAPTDAQVRGGLIAQGAGDLTSDDIYSLTMGNTPTEKVVGPDGRPRLTYGSLAARSGAEPFVNPGSEAAPTAITYDRGDGVRLGGVIDGSGQFLDATTRQPLTPEQAGSVAEVGKPMGTNDQLGITNSNRTEATRIEAAATATDLIVTDIESLIASRPGAAGAAGAVQRIGQDFVQTAREFNEMLNQKGVDSIVTPEFLDGLKQRASSGEYDPVFQQIRTYLLDLAYANAAIKNGGNEVSQSALMRELEALGQGALGNDESLKAALSVSRQAARIAREKAKVLKGGEAAAIPTIAEINAGGQSDPLAEARDAIAKGADPAKVRARLQEMGIDPGGL